MFEIRWHGRGGMGTVTAADITASAAIKAGFYALAFPEFGAERRGAPVTAYTRINKEIIYDRTPITSPDAVIVLDPYMITSPRVLAGLKEGGYLIANTTKEPSEILNQIADLRRLRVTVATVDATSIAMNILKQPIVNTAMIGALVAATNIVSLDDVIEVVRERFHGRLAEVNVNIINESYKLLKVIKP
ncbi:MAG: 2-oxoacid:acceptor oxidoreductase family protein [Desulfurococcaceae archaeon TW002]